MHPIERLRYVARARGADAEALVEETAAALRGLGLDPAGLVVAARRIVERHPTCAPLWWLCSRMLTDADPHRAAREAIADMRDDRTLDHLDAALPDDATVVTVGWPDTVARALARRGDIRVLAVDAAHEGSSFVQRLERADVECELLPAEAAALAAARADIVLIEAEAVDAGRVVAPIGSAVLAAVAGVTATSLWLVAGRGRRLPTPLLDGMIARVVDDEDPFDVDVEVLPTDSVTHVVGPNGWHTMSPAALAAECDVAPELLRSSPM